MRKPRLINGHEMPANLYEHQRRIPNKWRYLRPDGSYHRFEASIEEAIAAALQLNAQFYAGVERKCAESKSEKPGRLSFAYHCENFIADREGRDSSLLKKKSWANRKSSLKQFSRVFAHRTVGTITLLDIQPWWDKLTGNAQRSRKPELQRFFNYLSARKLCPMLSGNPFSTNDTLPRVEMSPAQPKGRQRLTLDQFWTIYDKALELGFDFMQVAMGVSLVTTMRRGDLCDIRLDQHVEGNILRKAINKSHAQLADPQRSISASNLSWRLDDDPMLRKLITKSRELSLKHGRCPHLLSFKPRRRVKAKDRTHTHQVLPDFLSDKFSEIADATGLFNGVPMKNRPSFHEVRALGSHLYERAGYEVNEVQELMAHTDEIMTKRYQAGFETRWTEINLRMPSAVTGREF